MERKITRRDLIIGAAAATFLSCTTEDKYPIPPTPYSVARGESYGEAVKKYEEWEKSFLEYKEKLPQLDICYEWPVKGLISSEFAGYHPLGIDIDLFDNQNADITAAYEGKVLFAGGNPSEGYGNYVVLGHEENMYTLYAHLSDFNVKRSDKVKTGQKIATAGSSGYSTGPHLHFEIIKEHKGNLYRFDPLKYLKGGDTC